MYRLGGEGVVTLVVITMVYMHMIVARDYFLGPGPGLPGASRGCQASRGFPPTVDQNI